MKQSSSGSMMLFAITPTLLVLVLLLLVSSSASCLAFSTSSSRRSVAAIQSRRLVRHSTSSSLFQSTILPKIANKDTMDSTNSNNAQPELGFDDLYEQQQQQKQKSMDPPRPGTVMKMLPKETFHVHTPTSLFYFGIDLAAVVASMGFLYTVVTSEFYHSVPIVLQGIMVAPLQILTGFTMWCMWCIGHDAGHSVVSHNSKVINRVVGEIAHSVICLTPFVPWAKSHRKHHLGHNHLTRDYSHQWFVREEQDNLHPLIKLSHWTRNVQLPILYFVYLFLGIPDGGHVLFYGRMWEGESDKEKLNALASVAVSMATAATLWSTMGFADFTVVCMIPWCVMSFWLFMVTYLQHHSADGKLYTDETFTFEKGAFETVDRNYGKWINRLSHHMMDGHVIHHLFFERVPHYRLEEATKALVEGLDAEGQSHFYKHIDTPQFTQEIVSQFDKNWFFVNEAQIVRK
eukprot:scaffold1376_cov125-Cylindrotheca_fusiformis.AAC.19